MTTNTETLIEVINTGGRNDIGPTETAALIAAELNHRGGVLEAFGQEWDNRLRSDDERSKLRPYIHRLGAISSSRAVEEQRSELATWWLVNVHTPAWLTAAGLTTHAEALTAMSAADHPRGWQRNHSHPTLDAAASAADSAAEAALNALGEPTNIVDDAVQAALAAAGGRAARLASRRVGGRAVDVTWDAATAAATTVAAKVCWTGVVDDDWAALQQEAIRDALEPTIETLQLSGLDLFNAMINTTDGSR